MSNLRVLHVDLDTGKLIAKPGSVGGVSGEYVKISGGTMDGPLYLSGDPQIDSEASNKRYVDLQITSVRDDLTQLASNISTGMAQLVNRNGDSMAGPLRLFDDPSDPLEAATKQYVDFQIQQNVILKTGGTMTGPLQLAGNPTLDSHAVSKGYIDQKITEINDTGLYLSVEGGEVTGPITLPGLPTDNNHAVTKEYVDRYTAGLSFKETVRVATIENINSLSGLLLVDGVQTTGGDRVLVKNQDNKVDNGIYEVSSGQWQRTPDAVGSGIQAGAVVTSTEGDVNADTGWVLSTDGIIDVGVTPLNFIIFSAAQSQDQFVDVSGDTMTGSLLLVGDPIDDNEAATKGYIDRSLSEIGYKYSQDVPANVWVIEHNRNSMDVMVQVFDSANEMVIPSKIKRDVDTVTIEFGTEDVTGSANLVFL